MGADPRSCMSRSHLLDSIGQTWVDEMHVGAELLQSSPPVEEVRQLVSLALDGNTIPPGLGGNGGSFFFSSFPVYAPSRLFALNDPAFVALNALESPVHIPSSELLPILNRKQPQPCADGYVVLPLATPREPPFPNPPERAERAVSTVFSLANLIQSCRLSSNPFRPPFPFLDSS
jgi:hypothetical protein